MPTNEPEIEEILPTWDQEPPLALPVENPLPADSVPLAIPVELPERPAPTSITCRICGSENPLSRSDCHDCGYHFTDADRAAGHPGGNSAPAEVPMVLPVASAEPAGPVILLQGRFELGQKVTERRGVIRYRGLDRGDGSGPPVPVFILQEKLSPPVPQAAEAAPDPAGDPDEILPTFDAIPTESGPTTDVLPDRPAWPSVIWEKCLLALEHPGLPRQIASFTEEGCDYLVEEVPAGQPLWDAWDDPERTSFQKYGYLVQLAETLHSLHQAHAILEGLRPDIVVVTAEGQTRITDLSDLLPLPFEGDEPIRGTAWTAPELLAGHGKVDARADLYGFGACSTPCTSAGS